MDYLPAGLVVSRARFLYSSPERMVLRKQKDGKAFHREIRITGRIVPLGQVEVLSPVADRKQAVVSQAAIVNEVLKVS
jgi:hypothetical protein